MLHVKETLIWESVDVPKQAVQSSNSINLSLLDFGKLISEIRYLNQDLKFEGFYRLMQVIFYYDNPCLSPHLTVPKIPYYILFSVTCYLDS